MPESAPLPVSLLGTTFQNPVLLAAGTCGFGREMVDVVDLEALGGIVTKSVTLKAREGNPAPRVAELDGGMLNSIGLANPGMEAVRRHYLPWLRDHLRKPRVLVSVAGHTVDEYEAVVRGLDDSEGFDAYELNLSCPNDTRLGGRPFALDPEALVEVVTRCRAATERPLVVKLAPNDPDPPRTASLAEESGADALTLVNTLPGLALHPETGRPLLGAGQGGVSGPALRAVGVRTVKVVRGTTTIPLIGVGGILAPGHAVEYLRAGASLVQMGTASFASPRAAERLIRQLPTAVGRHGLEGLRDAINLTRDAGVPSWT